MTLTDALRTASIALSNHSGQISVISKNVAGVGDPDYVKRDGVLTYGPGGAQMLEVARRIDTELAGATLRASSDVQYQQAQQRGLETMMTALGGPDFALSPAAGLGNLLVGLEAAAASPANSVALSSLVDDARNLAQMLNDASGAVVAARQNADQAISESVDRVNTLLAQFKEINDKVVRTTLLGKDPSDELDMRDELVKQIAGEIGIRTALREDNDMVLYATNGLTLFEKVPRAVEFQPVPIYGPSTTGNAVYIDGVAVNSGVSSMPLRTGNIAGQLALRDGTAVTAMNQLDEMARGLIDLFAERDQSVPATKPAIVGLFTWSGAPALPPGGALSAGLAGEIKVNAAYDPGQGGNANFIRDGGSSGDSDYVSNTAGAASFSDRLIALVDAFSADRTFDAAAGLPTTTSLKKFSDGALDWFQAERQSVDTAAQYRKELHDNLESRLVAKTGANLDEEMSMLLEVERSYQASTQIINAVDEMMNALMRATG